MYIGAMADNHPTYRLGPDFNDKLDQFVDKFICDGYECFAGEFARIEGFVEAACCDQSKRDDHDLRRTPKEKYLLEMVSYRIYDRLNREEFNKRKNTLIVMPDCLSLHNPDCERVERDYGTFCKRCLPTCQAYGISEVAKKYGAKCVFSKRSLDKQIEHFSKKMPDLSVVGVACIMMLAGGMRTAAEVSVPARGVLLNFTGCEHWNDQAFASEFTLASLEAILKEKYGGQS